MKTLHHFSLFLLISLSSDSVFSASPVTGGSDAEALLAFKFKADLNHNLHFSSNSSRYFCRWKGITCLQGRVLRLVLEGLDLNGFFPSDSLTHLDQLRVLSLQNNSLTGPIPDLSKLVNLKSLFINHNSFAGSFPPSIAFLHRLRTLDFSYNNFSGQIPTYLVKLDRLYYLRLDWNRFNGTMPPLNQSSLQNFNVSGNNLSGTIPVTSTLFRFGYSAFLHNPELCGEIINKECKTNQPFFGPTSAVPVPPPTAAILGQSEEIHGVEVNQPFKKTHMRTGVILGFSTGVIILIVSLLCFVLAVRKQRTRKQSNRKKDSTLMITSDEVGAAEAVMQIEQEKELEEKVKRVQGMQVAKSGNLVFCAGEAQLYSLDQLMRGSAELLGRGTIGTTYKAVLDNRLIVTVKRLDAGKLAATSKDVFEQHMQSVGGLRHPNLVPLRAYFQAKDERLLIYDYQPNGSLFSLIHGSKSTRAKPLHWTSCLKIADDIAQGLSYIHQAWRLVHGNLKSSNVLLGPDFEACISDYCLTILINLPSNEDTDSYKAPEIRNSMNQLTTKSDVYAFGILLLELLTGSVPLQNPVADANELMNWVKSAREDGNEDECLGMLVEVAIACRMNSPEQRPTMWQVLKMIQEIKESVLIEDNEMDP